MLLKAAVLLCCGFAFPPRRALPAPRRSRTALAAICAASHQKSAALDHNAAAFGHAADDEEKYTCHKNAAHLLRQAAENPDDPDHPIPASSDDLQVAQHHDDEAAALRRSPAWAAATAATNATTVDAIKRVRRVWRDAKTDADGSDKPAVTKMAKELSTLAELGFARCVRLNLTKQDQAELDKHVRTCV